MHLPVDGPPRSFSVVRDTYLNEYSGKNLEGLDTDRIEDFFAQEELVTKPYVVITPDDLDRLDSIDKPGLLRGSFQKSDKDGYRDVKAVYAATLGLSIIVRDRRLEELNGPAFTEGLIVHEGAHSTADITDCSYDTDDGGYFVPRTGFALIHPDNTTSGSLFEEGISDRYRGMYLAQHSATGTLSKVAEATGWTQSVEDMITLDVIAEPTQVPFKYAHLAEDGQLGILTSAIAAHAIELLIQADPDIDNAMHLSRTDAAGLRMTAAKINNLSPGLYSNLRLARYNDVDFALGLHAIADEVYGDLSDIIRQNRE